MKKLLSVISVLVLVFLVSACGSVGIGKTKTIKVDDDMTITYSIDAPYYGKIKIGSKTFDMLSTDDMLKEQGIERNMFRVYGYKIKETDDYFAYDTMKYDESYEVKLYAHSNIYEEMGCKDCDEQLVNSIELPKGITFKSTIEDVIKAYGEPSERNEYDDNNYQWSETTSGEKLGGIESDELEYDYETEKAEMRLELWFSKNTGKLHRVEYQIEVKQ